MSDLENFSGIWFLVQQALNKISTNTLVKVVSFVPNPAGGLLAGTVNVQPLVNQVDPQGNATAHGVVYGLPYFRLQAGNSAIIADPAANDIGMAGFCSRDISSVKANAGQANPGSARTFDMSDGIYFGGIGSLNGAPTEYIQMTGNGINVVSPGQIALKAQGKTWTLGTAGLTLSNGVVVETHIHTQGADSHGDTEENTNGPQNP